MQSWNAKFHGSIHLHGHTHGHMYTEPGVNRLEVGVDVNDYYPVSFDEIMEKLNKASRPLVRPRTQT